MGPKGQILPESNFGQALTALARNSNTIVEIGCWRGGGSTKCLALGLVRPEQKMWSIDASPEMIAESKALNHDERISFLCGTVLRPDECVVSTEHLDLKDAVQEMENCSKLPYIGEKLPEDIDLLLLDGGEFSSRSEFIKLRNRCKIIALDDIRKEASWKNYQNHQDLISVVEPMFHFPNDRNGWSVFKLK